ncbi:MAG: SpoIID/LytB domain-containing protein [Clostridia bacterium]|nr:SpoIID/LytB domain-containing protein [Clostridia bacterium]
MMKRSRLIFLFLFLLTLLLALSMSTVCAKNISIGLKYNTTSPKEITVQNASGFTVTAADEWVTSLAETQILVVWAEDGSIQLLNPIDSTIVYAHVDGKTPLTLFPADNGTVIIGETEYRGAARFLHTDMGLTVINYVDIEDYIKGVVPGEMPYSWHKEALKAQAVCARNYAVSNWNKFAKYGFNLDDSIQSQVYLGVKAEKPESNAAVEETRGLYLKYGDKYADTLFFSSSGGHTENSENVWSSPLPYLVGVEDPYDTSKEWTVPYTPDEIEEKLAGIGVNIGDVVDLEVIETSASGRIIDLKIIGTEGNHNLKKDKTRSLFNFRSNLYTITKKGTDPKPIAVVTSKGLEERVVDQPILTATQIIPVEIGTPTEYVMTGTGYGHGVGMSQYGAKGMAEAGYNFEQILQHYYTGTVLADESEPTEITE